MRLLKLMPIAALALVGGAGVQGLKKNADIIGKMKSVAAQTVEMQGIADAVAMAYTETETLPLENFPAFLKAHLREAKGGGKRDRSRDVWGTEYRLALVTNGFEVRSAGPDQHWGTDDDVKKFYESAEIGRAYAPLGTVRATAAAPSLPAPPGFAPASPRPPTQSQEETQRKVLQHQKRLAEKGYPSAQYDLGLRYLRGDGVEKDATVGRQWLQKAAQNGRAEAAQRLQQLADPPP